jgi:RpiR family carbohydrate utilization transcriptional regulator
VAFDPGIPLLEHLAAELPTLRRSEKKVAELVASDPGFIVQGTMAAVAEAAGVSEPTVMRFCTALGYDGFNQFRLALAQSVALGLPATLSTVSAHDSIAVMASKVFDHSISSLDRARRYLDAEQIERAVDAILGAPSSSRVSERPASSPRTQRRRLRCSVCRASCRATRIRRS